VCVQLIARYQRYWMNFRVLIRLTGRWLRWLRILGFIFDVLLLLLRQGQVCFIRRRRSSESLPCGQAIDRSCVRATPCCKKTAHWKKFQRAVSYLAIYLRLNQTTMSPLDLAEKTCRQLLWLDHWSVGSANGVPCSTKLTFLERELSGHIFINVDA